MNNRLLILIAACLIGVCLHPAAAAKEKDKEAERQKVLDRYAKESLSRLKLAIKKEGFYNGRVALNVWQSNALDAGTFDQALYDKLKRQIYRKSIENNLRWFDIFLEQKNYYDARICLQLWRIHSKEIGVLDEDNYLKLENKLTPKPQKDIK